MHFYRTPVEVVAGDLGRVKGLKLERTKLVKNGSHQRAIATGEMEVLPVGFVTHLDLGSNSSSCSAEKLPHEGCSHAHLRNAG